MINSFRRAGFPIFMIILYGVNACSESHSEKTEISISSPFKNPP